MIIYVVNTQLIKQSIYYSMFNINKTVLNTQKTV